MVKIIRKAQELETTTQVNIALNNLKTTVIYKIF